MSTKMSEARYVANSLKQITDRIEHSLDRLVSIADLLVEMRKEVEALEEFAAKHS